MKNKKTRFINSTNKTFEEWEKELSFKSISDNQYNLNYNLNFSLNYNNSRFDFHGKDTQDLNRIVPNIIKEFLNNPSKHEIEIVTGQGSGALATELEDLLVKSYPDEIKYEKSLISAAFILRKK